MRIESANCRKPGRNQNRSRSHLGGKKEQMKKITPLCVISLLFIFATGLTLTLFSGCKSAPRAAGRSLNYAAVDEAANSSIVPLQKQREPSTRQTQLQHE